ncbi:MAG: hypothetical protein OXG15_00225 [Gammaproteobacteria bacterium]|nr:hypothetical protein [Gammaproteobacteria bacterium]
MNQDDLITRLIEVREEQRKTREQRDYAHRRLVKVLDNVGRLDTDSKTTILAMVQRYARYVFIVGCLNKEYRLIKDRLVNKEFAND